MKTNNKFGYKICYKELGKTKYKIYLVTNTFDLAVFEIRWYENNTHKDTKHNLHLFEVKTVNEYEKLWKGCPFKDDFSLLKGENK